MLYLKCKGQVVSIDVDERFADKYINANTVHFEFCERWAGMTITAQFTQNEKTYDVLVDEVTNTVTMPNEITVGEVEISVFGVHPETGVRLTTIPVKKKVEKSGFVGDGETPIPPSPDLYAQLIAKVEDAELAQAENIKNAVDAYLTENPVEPGATKEQAEQIEANRKAIEEYVPPVTSVNGMTGDVVIAAGGGAASSVEWSNVVNKPETYPPEAHGHTWNDVTEKPEAYPPSEHTHSYADLEDKPTIPTVPRFLPNPYALTINGVSYDGSNAVDVTIDAGNDVEIDETLTQGGKAADAKKTGEALSQLSEKNAAQDEALTQLNQAIVALWTAGKTYAVNDYCTYNNTLYKCKTQHTSGSTFDANYWKRVTVAEEIGVLNSFVTLQTGAVEGIYYIKVGRMVMVNICDIVLTDGMVLGVPNMLANTVIHLRNESRGGLSSITISRDAYLAAGAGANNFTDGDRYSGGVVYITRN